MRKVQLDILTNEDMVDTGKTIIVKNEPLRMTFTLPKMQSVDYYALHLKVPSAEADVRYDSGTSQQAKDQPVLAAD